MARLVPDIVDADDGAAGLLIECRGWDESCLKVLSTATQCSRQNLETLAELLAEHLLLCCLSRESWEFASFYKLQFCRGLLSM